MPKLPDSQRLTLDAISRWKQTVTEELDDVACYRHQPQEAAFHRQWGLDPSLWADTSQIVGYITTHHSNLKTEPILTVHRHLNLWHANQSARKLPTQEELSILVEEAVLTVNAVEAAILAQRERAIAHNSPTRSQRRSLPPAIPADVAKLLVLVEQGCSPSQIPAALEGDPFSFAQASGFLLLRDGFRIEEDTDGVVSTKSIVLSPSGIIALTAHRMATDAANDDGKAQPETKGNGKSPKPTINTRMIDTLQRKPEAKDWTLAKWADYLHCSQGTVGEKPAWKNLMQEREAARIAGALRSEPSARRR